MLTLRGLWSRGLLSLAALLVAALVTAVGVVGPTFARSATESLLQQRLKAQPYAATGISMSAQRSGRVSITKALGALTDVVLQAGDPAYFGDPVAYFRTAASPGSVGSNQIKASLLWRPGMCADFQIDGHCPTDRGEAAIAASTAALLRSGVGDHVMVSPSPGTEGAYRVRDLRIVGVYQTDARSVHGFSTGLFTNSRQSGTTLVAPLLVGSAEMSRWPWAVSVSRGLRTSLLNFDSASAAARQVALLEARFPANTLVSGMPTTVGPETALPQIVDEVKTERDELSPISIAAMVPLLGLGLFLMFSLAAAAADQRRPELALGKLRGLPRRRIVGFALAEPLTVLLVGLGAGLLLGRVIAAGLVEIWLRPGTATAVGPAAWLAVATVAGCGLAVCTGSAWKVIAEPLAQQLTEVARSRGSERFVVIVQTLAVALALAGVYQAVHESGAGATTSLISLLAPLFVGLALAVVGRYGIVLMARIWVGFTQHGHSTAGFLAARRLSRRREAGTLAAPLVIAIGLAAFAIGSYQVAAGWWLSEARAQVGAAEMVNESVGPRALLAATHLVDPRGRYLMAVLSDVNGPGIDSRLYVDAPRLPTVASWDPSWARQSVAELAHELQPAPVDPVMITGRKVGLTVRADHLKRQPASLALGLTDPSGYLHEETVGALVAGHETTLDARIPYCQRGCELTRIEFSGASTTPVNAAATVEFRKLTVDGAPIDARFRAAQTPAWRVVGPLPASGHPKIALTSGPRGMIVDFDTDGSLAILGITTNDVPAVHPVVATDAVTFRRIDSGPAAGLAGLGPDGEYVPITVASRVDTLPIVERDGVMSDLSAALRDSTLVGVTAQTELWLAPDVPASTRARLQGMGLLSGESTRLDTVHTELSHDGFALGLRLFLAVGLAAIALALAGIAGAVGVQVRSRAFEVAALGVVGVGRRTMLRATLLEFTVLLAVATGLGALAGFVSCRFVLPAIGVGPVAAASPEPDFGVRWGELGLIVGLTALVAMVLVGTLSVLVTRLGKADLLRER
jgi:hypothetical protein